MGSHKYVSELWKKKQCDVMRFLRRIRTWHYRQLSSVHRASRPTRPDKAKSLGYRAKQGKYYRVCSRIYHIVWVTSGIAINILVNCELYLQLVTQAVNVHHTVSPMHLGTLPLHQFVAFPKTVSPQKIEDSKILPGHPYHSFY